MKTTMSFVRVFTCVTLGLACSLAAEEKKRVLTDFSDVPEGWLVGLDRAKEEAAASSKDILLDFSGSDWIPPSIELEERVFSKKEFAEAASDEFVLVRLDFPRKLHIQSEALQKKNLEAVAEYEVQSYPTIILTDSKGRPYASTGYKDGLTVESFMKILSELQESRKQRDAHLAKAAKAEGAAKVPHLVKAITGHTPGAVLRFYKPEFHEICKHDPKNSGGLGSVVFYEQSLAMRVKLDALAIKDDWEGAIKVLDEFGKEHAKTTRQKQQIEFFKINGLLQMKRVDEVMPFLDRVIAMDPESAVGKKANSLKPELKKRIEEAMKLEKEDAARLKK